MKLADIDLNLLIFLDVLLDEQNVSRAAERMNMTQPAMSNALKRLRALLNDPLLVRTRNGMTPTPKAIDLAPQVKQIVESLEHILSPSGEFEPAASDRVFRIMASDYAASTLMPPIIERISPIAPNIAIDVMTPSDVSVADVELGNVDLAINRFDALPGSFHQRQIWHDDFACVMSANNPISSLDLTTYLQAQHVWVSKTGYGVGVGMKRESVQQQGWVDAALQALGHERHIQVFTRNYQVAIHLARTTNMIATLPYRAAMLVKDDPALKVVQVPFTIPQIELKMIWSELLHKDAGHQWLRGLIIQAANEISF
ncbi:LysR family transcriptional regulator [Salinibius halmophilus]|uniref:LysR family transcriptional regulator n=1 Tax=Salinibius halmophilus TaxID=1853216 RepID=UPI000E66C38E|nr:LysR family transcriptional regulator [Salinibius halmophilus]